MPRPLLEQVGIEPDADVELTAEGGRLVIEPARRPRQGWAKAFAGRTSERLLLPEVETEFARKEWSW